MSLIRTKVETLKPGSEYVATVRLRNTDLNVLSEYSDTIRFKVPSDTTIPGKLQNLKIYANYMTVMFAFDPSNEKDAAEYEYELYNFDQVQQVGSTLEIIEGNSASFSGRNRANVFTVSLSEDFSSDQPNSYINTSGNEIIIFWYGRVRTIDTAGNIGPWSDIVRSDDTPLIEDQFVKNLTASKITAGTIGAHTITLAGTNSIIQSSNYSENVSGWIIKGNGFAEFDSTVIRGGLKAGSVFIDANNRWNADTSGNVLGNNYFKVGSSTKYVEWDPNLLGGTLKISGNIVGGTITIGGSPTVNNAFNVDETGDIWSGHASKASAPFRVSNAGVLTASGASITGSVFASNGNIGGWTIDLQKISAGGTELNSNGIILCRELHTKSTLAGSIELGANIGNGEEIFLFTEGLHGTQSLPARQTIRATDRNVGGPKATPRIRISTSPESGTAGPTYSFFSTPSEGFVASSGATIRTDGLINAGSATISGNLSAGSATVSGSIRTANGSQAAPSHSFTGQTSTGMYLQSPTRFHIVRAGADRLTFDGSGIYPNVGSTANTATWRVGSLGALETPTSNIDKKDNISDINENIALSVLKKIRPVEFTYKPFEGDTAIAASLRSVDKHIGFIAEWMSEVDAPWSLAEYKPNIVNEMSQQEKKEAIQSLDSWVPYYWKESHMIALLTAAVKSLIKRIEDIEEQIAVS